MAKNVMNLKEVGSDVDVTRGQRIWKRLREMPAEPGKISIVWPRLVTASYKETEGLTPALRLAKSIEKQCNEAPLFQEDDEQLLMGSGNPGHWETRWNVNWTGGNWLLQELEQGLVNDVVKEEDLDEVKEIAHYWKDKCILDVFPKLLEAHGLLKHAFMNGEPGAYVYNCFGQSAGAKAMDAVDHAKLLRIGYKGLLEEIEAELQATEISDPESYQKIDFLRALHIAHQSAMHYINRHAEWAKELAGNAEGKRKSELERMAEGCAWIAEKPPRTFYEALQLMWFMKLFDEMETKALAVSPGRMDQLLYPFYQKDIEQGTLTRQEALEMLECYRIKVAQLRIAWPAIARDLTSQLMLVNVTLGGQTPDGKDATNELSYLFLEAAEKTRTPHPTLSVRVHDRSPREFLLKAIEVASLGMGFPAFFGDRSMMAAWSDWGLPLNVTRDYQVSGCTMPVLPGTTGWNYSVILNVPKVLELAMHDGVDPRTTLKIGPDTGRFEDFKTFDEFYEAFKKQAEDVFSKSVPFTKVGSAIVATLWSSLFASALIADCIKNGKATSGGCGQRYWHDLGILNGAISTSDSLAAIKKLVFEEGKIGKKELLDALAANFEGYEEIHRLCLAAPKYGNDDDYADNLAADLYKYFNEMIGQQDGFGGRKMVNGNFSYSSHFSFGKIVDALPNGRLLGKALSDGSVSAEQGMDMTSATALVNSAGKIDQMSHYADLMNIKFHPSALRTKEDQEKLLALIKTHLCTYGSKHVQLNVVGKKTLIEAKERPEAHRDLLVRVAGYSAFFTQLDGGVQDEIIERAEHTWSCC
ncbi:MAG: hypothetical protein HKP58_12305 [Desulfatitalea sp.]|nr:hypothetical protein [Desulfatitalea sp.]NNK01183.1 hypothetical protein [Desulfatitalea sp.]